MCPRIARTVLHHLHDQKHSEHIAAHIMNEIQMNEDTSPMDDRDTIPLPIGMVAVSYTHLVKIL